MNGCTPGRSNETAMAAIRYNSFVNTPSGIVRMVEGILYEICTKGSFFSGF